MHPDLLHFSLFGHEQVIQSYGVLMIAGVAAGIVVAVRRAKGHGLEPFDVLAIGLLGFVGGLLGSLALYFAVHLPKILADPTLLRAPGLVFYGGLGGGALAASLYCRAYGVPLRTAADLVAPSLALAHAIGRIGCFLGGCCYGREVEPEFPLGVPLRGVLRHPVQLYEAVGLLTLTLALLWLSDRLRAHRGALFLLYIGGYALLRITTEGLRGDDVERGFVWPGLVSTSQAIAGLVLIASLAAFGRVRRSQP